MNRLLQKFLPARHAVPPIALLTDFGTMDHYAGTVKGVIASVNSSAHVIDISHSVSPQHIPGAAYLLWTSHRFFPSGTIFVVVVDPGVGTGRSILLLRTDSRWFLIPDNGVADFVLRDHGVDESYKISERGSRYVSTDLSGTFHGRDIFAPVASYLSLGVSPEELGDSCPPPSVRYSFCRKPDRKASVLHVDHFGNIVTDIQVGRGEQTGGLSVKGKAVRRWINNYAEAPQRSPCLIRGSSGLVEIVVKNGNAARMLGITVGVPVRVSWT